MNKIVQNRNHQITLLYWKCQLVGWGLVSLFWLYIAIWRDSFTITEALINYVLDIVICIGLTHLYRTVALKRNWNTLSIGELLGKVIPALIMLSILFMVCMNIKTSVFIHFLSEQNKSINTLFVWNPFFVWNPVLITGLRHMAIWLLAYHLFHFYHREVQITKMNAELSLIAKQAQFDSLSAQLNPHFLFNSLNSIKALIIENPQIARRAVDLLSEILRSSLYEKQQTTVSLKEELALVKDYLELEKLRFEERLQIHIEIDEELQDIKVLPLSIQLLVENALKHGIDQQISGGLLTISAKKVHDNAIFSIKNPGKIISSNQKGIGLKNLTNRIKLAYKEKGHFEIKSHSDNTVLATMSIPINEP